MRIGSAVGGKWSSVSCRLELDVPDVDQAIHGSPDPTWVAALYPILATTGRSTAVCPTICHGIRGRGI